VAYGSRQPGQRLRRLGQKKAGTQDLEVTSIMKQNSNSKSKPTCRIVRAEKEFIGKQGLVYAPGISAESVGAQGIHLQIVTIPPGGRAKAHKHEAHETAIYILSGESGVWHGERLEGHLFVRAGDFLYIPADMPHLPYNPSDTENCIAVIARTDPNEQESVVLLPAVDRVHPAAER
jgi:uncharacterized RmlC-like cupin family protein